MPPDRSATRSGTSWAPVTAAALVLAAGLTAVGAPPQPKPRFIVGEKVATGARITPTAAPDSTFETLDPGIAADPSIRANQGVTTVTSPDGRTLLVLTSGYNYWDLPGGIFTYDEFVFVYDISGGRPVKTQVLRIPYSFMGIAFAPSGQQFYVAGGLDDAVRVFARGGSTWAESGEPIALGHPGTGLGLDTGPLAGGLAVTRNGRRLVVANVENDSVSLVDLEQRREIAERDLRPGKNDPAKAGVPGGDFPLWVAIKGETKAYVSSMRGREIVVLDLTGDQLRITNRIGVSGTPRSA